MKIQTMQTTTMSLDLSKSLDLLKKQYAKAKKAYYNKEPILSDATFDKLEDHIRKQDPNWGELHKTGVKVGKKVEVALAHPMPSLNKAYPAEFPRWVAKNVSTLYVVMEKLDGSSVQLTYNGCGEPEKLVTRGDGINGKDISFLIPYLNLPTKPMKGMASTKVVFRCEAVMAKSVFTKKWASKFENSRNLVNGLLNRTDAHVALKDIDFVVLGCYGMSLKHGFEKAAHLGLRPVGYRLYGKPRSINAPLLEDMRATSPYDMDGLVVAPGDFVLDYKNADKPKGIIAFKVNDEANAEVVTVKRIIWQVTGRGRIVPKIEIEPTRMDGVMVKHCTAHNAAWMLERKIGPGAKVKVLRSGGVIPKIVEVVKPGKFQQPDIPYIQDGVHFLVIKASKATTERVDVLNIVKFMKTLGIELVAGKTATALYAAGLTSPLEYINAFGQKRLGLLINTAGFDGKQGVKIYDEIRRVFGSTLSMKKLMVASQVFGVGIGERKLSQIEDAGISMAELTYSEDFPSNYIEQVPGFAGKTCQVLDEGFVDWVQFFSSSSQYLTIDGSLPKKAKAVKGGKLDNLKVSFTGYRDKEQEAWVVANGGEVVPFGSKTEFLLFKDGGKSSTKVDKAKDKGIKVGTFQQLEKQK